MRQGKVERNTEETKIYVGVNLDSTASDIDTGIGFFDHMLDLLAFHGKIGLEVKAEGDLVIDDHHTIEDIGIAFGQAFRQALGDRKGIRRYSSQKIPMDEALVDVSLDISNRPYLVFNGEFKRESLGGMSTEMVKEFFYAFAINCGLTLHINVLYGDNDHHKVEGIFKAFGRALGQASQVIYDDYNSTKGVL